MLCPTLPPKVAWAKIPSPGLKKENIPHRAKARTTPPTNQFQRLTEAEKRPFHTTQIITPRAAASIKSPAPNSVSASSHILAPNKYSNTTTTITNMVLRTIGEATKLKKFFFFVRFLFAFRFGL
jgi:hypothetical protein